MMNLELVPTVAPHTPLIPAKAGIQRVKLWVPACAGTNGDKPSWSNWNLHSPQRAQVPDRAAGRDRLRRGDDGVGVDAVVPIKVGNGAGLAEMLNA